MNPIRTFVRGFYGIGIYNPKHKCNHNTIYRSAFNFGANFLFTINGRYKSSASDTPKAYKHVPFFHFPTIDDFIISMPKDSVLVGVELNHRARKLDNNYVHPERACYLLGSEDAGIPDILLDQCDQILQIPAVGQESLNVAVAGSILLYHRYLQKNNNVNTD